MIWPMTWGKESGSALLPAFAGAFITSVLFVLFAYIALARWGSYYQMSRQIFGKKFGHFFSLLTIIILGPLFVIPRMSAAAWDALAFAFHLPPRGPLFIVFTISFYLISYLFLTNPGKTLDRISKLLFPILLITVSAIVIKGLSAFPAPAPPPFYERSPLNYGFTSGYATAEILCALIFGFVLVRSIQEKGVKEEQVHKNLFRVALAGMALLALVHFFHMLIGSKAGRLFPELSYTSLYTAVAMELFGQLGGLLVSIGLIFAALTTAIGMGSGCAEFLMEVYEDKFSYKKLAGSICILSAFFASMGLTSILAYIGPSLDAVYPAVIVIVLYGAFSPNPEKPSALRACRLAAITAFLFGIVDLIWKYMKLFQIPENGLMKAYLRLPGAADSLAYLPWTIGIFVFGLIFLRRKEEGCERETRPACIDPNTDR